MDTSLPSGVIPPCPRKAQAVPAHAVDSEMHDDLGSPPPELHAYDHLKVGKATGQRDGAYNQLHFGISRMSSITTQLTARPYDKPVDVMQCLSQAGPGTCDQLDTSQSPGTYDQVQVDTSQTPKTYDQVDTSEPQLLYDQMDVDPTRAAPASHRYHPKGNAAPPVVPQPRARP